MTGSSLESLLAGGSESTRGQVKPWVPILMYHRIVPVLPAQDPFLNCVSVAMFERQLRWLAQRGYRSQPLSALDTLGHTSGDLAAPIPRRTIVITFDDGYRDNYLYALPLLRRYGLTATIFLVADAVGGDNRFDERYGGDTVDMLSVDEIREMQREGIQFGSHTCTHPPSLPRLSDSQLEYEVHRSRTVLENILNAPVDHFSYPHSQLDDRVQASVARAGYRLACAGVGTQFSRYRLNRIEPPGRVGRALFVQQRWPILSGAGLEAHIRWRQLKRAVLTRFPRGTSRKRDH